MGMDMQQMEGQREKAFVPLIPLHADSFQVHVFRVNRMGETREFIQVGYSFQIFACRRAKEQPLENSIHYKGEWAQTLEFDMAYFAASLLEIFHLEYVQRASFLPR